MLKAKPRVRINSEATKGEVIPVKVMIKHPMENGRRRDKTSGKLLPRMIINKFVCSYNGRDAFIADMNPSVSSNPYFVFFLRAKESGEVKFTFTEDSGESVSVSKKLVVK